MILGRPTNLWLGLTGSLIAFLQVAIVTLLPGVDPVAVATVLGALGLLLGAVVALVANQPPTLAPGQTFNIATPAGQPNYVTTVAHPPAADAPPVPEPGT